jgi:RWD domain
MYAALQYSSSEEEEDANADIQVPDYEDLSSNRADEVTVLDAVYGSDFTVDTDGAWKVRAMDQNKQHELIISIKPNQKYPYCVPKISISSPPNSSSRKLHESEEQQLKEELTARAKELAESGSVMMIELVQV